MRYHTPGRPVEGKLSRSIRGGRVAPAMNVTRYKCSVLVVDDDRGVLSVLAAQLEPDFEVLTAACAAEAREVLAKRNVDMLLTDLHLPDDAAVDRFVAQIEGAPAKK